MQLSGTILKSLAHLFYPNVCTGCGTDILKEDSILCLQCINELPHTNFSKHTDNPVEKIFWGRLGITAAMSEFYFAKGTLIQKLIHQLKYRGDKEIGLYLGKIMGSSLANNDRFTKIDALVPLPLNAYKEHKRGYNQAAVLCKGMAEILNTPVITSNVIRKRFTDTQTKKHRAQRWENVEGSFEILNNEEFKGKHILLVDDVITTGATLEACGEEILKINGAALSIATLAFAAK